jgi:hypothetical protein
VGQHSHPPPTACTVSTPVSSISPLANALQGVCVRAVGAVEEMAGRGLVPHRPPGWVVPCNTLNLLKIWLYKIC